MSPSKSNGFTSRGLGGYQNPRQNRINDRGNASDSDAWDSDASDETLVEGNAADEIVARRVREILFAMSVSDATNMNTLQIGAPKRTNTNNLTTPTTWSYTTFDEWHALITKRIKTPAIQRNGAPKHTNTNNSKARATYYTFDEWHALMTKGTKTPVRQDNTMVTPKQTNANNSSARATYYTFDEWKALMAQGTKTSVDQHSQGKTQAVLLAKEALAAAEATALAAVDEALKLLNASEKLVEAAKGRLLLAKTWPAAPELEGEL